MRQRVNLHLFPLHGRLEPSYRIYRVGKTYIKYIVGGSGEGVDGDITAKGHYDD